MRFVEENKVIKRIFFNKQFIVFIAIGGINTMSSAVFSEFYTLLIGKVQAFIPGYITGILISYILNTLFTFKEKFSWNKLIQFALSTVPNFTVQFMIVYIGIRLFHLPSIVCYGLAAIIGMPITFLILKLLVYKDKGRD